MTLNRITLITDLPFKIPEIEYIGDKLPWHHSLKWDDRPLENIRRIIVHHMASESLLVNQARYHINTHNWPGLSYHLAVSEGRLKQINDPRSITYHAAGNNEDSVSISIHGDLSKRELRADERELLYAGILTLKKLFPIEEVIGHNEVNATACPCISMNQVRDDIARIESQMRLANDPNKVKDEIRAAASQHVYLFNQYQSDPVKHKWLEPHLLHIFEEMRSHGLFFGKY